MGREQTDETRIKLSLANGGSGKIRTKNSGLCLSCDKPINKLNKYCSQQCHQDYQYKEKIRQWLNEEISGTRKGGCCDWIRRYLFEKYDNKCSRCGWGEINPYSKTPLPALEIEHIDGNSENNKEENLTLLCPNCQALTPTYKALNIGNGRRTYMEKYYIKDEHGKIIRGS